MINTARNRFYLIFFLSIYIVKQHIVSYSIINSILDSITSLYIVLIASYFLCRYLISIIPIIPTDPRNKAVIVTGAASGFGRKLTIRLDKLGFTVFAGVRNVVNDPRVDSLVKECSKKLQVIKLDITSDQDVNEAVISVGKILSEKQLGK